MIIIILRVEGIHPCQKLFFKISGNDLNALKLSMPS